MSYYVEAQPLRSPSKNQNGSVLSHSCATLKSQIGRLSRVFLLSPLRIPPAFCFFISGSVISPVFLNLQRLIWIWFSVSTDRFWSSVGDI
ncbi:hypothetical protein ACOSQ4_029255 [Xanthoceras sorbifolium]